MLTALSKLSKLFSWYPPDSLIRPGLMDKINLSHKDKSIKYNEGVICIQGVPDKFFFLLFNLIAHQIKNNTDIRVELIIVRSINAAVGFGWLAAIKRLSVLSWWWMSQWERAWGVSKDGIAYRCAPLFQPLNNLLLWRKSKIIWKAFKHQTEDYSLVLDGIEIGDLIVDSYLRFRPSPRFEPTDPFVRYLIWQALRDLYQAECYFGKKKPRLYVSSYSSYIEHGVTIRVALKHGVPVYTFGDHTRFTKKLSVEDPYHTIDFSRFREEFNRLDRQDERLEEARVQLEIRLKGGIDAATVYMKKSAYKNENVELPSDFSGAVVIFLHDFYDSYNAYPNLIFCDFWRWICFTIETFQEKNIKFYLKQHPNQIGLSDIAIDDLRASYPNAKWLPSRISNLQMVDGGMLCGVTAYGSVAHELAYLGVPTIGYGRHPHHSFDFCRTAKSREEYKDMLESPWATSLDKEEMKRQALIFYYMRNLFGSNDDILLRQAYIELWKVCNISKGNDAETIEKIKNLSNLPELKSFIKNLNYHTYK
jgi:hypothetical protein